MSITSRELFGLIRSAPYADLRAGLRFDVPMAHSRRDRKIGDNPVVLKAIDTLAPHASDPFFLMLVPEEAGAVEQWWQQTLCDGRDNGPFDFRRWGFVSIRDIERFCIETQLEETLQVFRFNHGQLFSVPA